MVDKHPDNHEKIMSSQFFRHDHVPGLTHKHRNPDRSSCRARSVRLASRPKAQLDSSSIPAIGYNMISKSMLTIRLQEFLNNDSHNPYKKVRNWKASEAMMDLPVSPNNELENRQDEVHEAGTEPQSLRGSLHPQEP